MIALAVAPLSAGVVCPAGVDLQPCLQVGRSSVSRLLSAAAIALAVAPPAGVVCPAGVDLQPCLQVGRSSVSRRSPAAAIVLAVAPPSAGVVCPGGVALQPCLRVGRSSVSRRSPAAAIALAVAPLSAGVVYPAGVVPQRPFQIVLPWRELPGLFSAAEPSDFRSRVAMTCPEWVSPVPYAQVRRLAFQAAPVVPG